jgi:hypothetical protein
LYKKATGKMWVKLTPGELFLAEATLKVAQDVGPRIALDGDIFVVGSLLVPKRLMELHFINEERSKCGFLFGRSHT